MEFNLGSFFVNLAIIFGGMVFLKGDPSIILGYDEIKDNSKKIKKMKRQMKIIGILFLLYGLLWLFTHILYFLRKFT